MGNLGGWIRALLFREYTAELCQEGLTETRPLMRHRDDTTLQNIATADKFLAQAVTQYSEVFSKYLSSMFSGTKESPQKLLEIIGKGAILDMPVDLSAVKNATKKALAAKIIQAAWKIAPDGAGAHPFIL